MPRYILLSEKSWHYPLFTELCQRHGEEWIYINNREDFNFENLKKLAPEKIFIPHWSYIIPEKIFSEFDCIVFHMTDLPFGRGGSPLQNLILLGLKETCISALKVSKGLDTGPVYAKKELNLEGSAQEIFLRSVPVIRELILKIIDNNIVPEEQNGEVVLFKRRQPAEGNISNLSDLNKVYDYIRMLDAETYPNAFIETEELRIEFFNAEKSETEINANVRIIKK